MPRVLLPALLAALLLTGACGAAGEPAAGPARQVPSQRPQAAPGHTPRPSAAPTRAPETAQARPERRRDRDRKVAPLLPLARETPLRSHLLTATTLPLLGGHPWTAGATGPERRRPVGACQKTPLVDIGAVEAVQRGFAGPEGSGVSARQVVARFADARSAWRAHEVLVAWRDDCEERLGRPTWVGPLHEVPLSAGDGDHYRSARGTRPDRDTAGLGIHRRGAWLSVVVLTSPQVDYPRDWQPSRRAVRRIAATFA